MVILHYIPTIDKSWGGTTSYIQLLAQELGNLVELHIVTRPSASPSEVKNCTLHFLQSKLIWKIKKEWQALLSSIRPDLVHINGCWLPSCALTQKWAQEMGFKVILTPHGMLEPWIISRNYWSKKLPALLLYQRKAILRADMLHATAKSEQANLLRLGYNDKIKVIPNGINIPDIATRGNNELHKKILFLSRIHIKKGIELLLEAAASMKNELSGYTIVIAGEGKPSYVEQLEDRIRRLDINAMVQFVGGVYGPEKWTLFQESNLFVLPTYSENFGIVVAEALSTGTPVITTTGTPWAELNERGCGWCIDLSVENLSAALREALKKDEGELQEMGLKGRELVQEKYDIVIVSRQMMNFYETLIN